MAVSTHNPVQALIGLNSLEACGYWRNSGGHSVCLNRTVFMAHGKKGSRARLELETPAPRPNESLTTKPNNHKETGKSPKKKY
jgi:hypothetical protein